MKNFPHQINQLPRLNAAVRVIADLIDAGGNIDDDGIVGDALARSGVYTFRNAAGGGAIEQQLLAEHGKPIGSQGTRAAARDLRRFFRLLAFVRRNDKGRWTVGESGRSLLRLNSPADAPRMRELWHQALLDMALGDEQGTSHPYRILIRLVAEVPGLRKPYSGLCLEAADDGPAEFARIVAIARRPNPAATMNAVAGEHMSRNSTKILPALAVQLGDISDSNGQLTITTKVSDLLFDPGRAGPGGAAIQNLVRRPFAPRKRTAVTLRRRGNSGITSRRYDPDLIGARFNDHEDCLDRFRQLLPPNIECFEATYDLLVVAKSAALLVEAKTIRNDERAQVRIALGQLYYYQYFDVAPLYPNHIIKRVLLTDRRLAGDVCEFLTGYEIGVIWMPPDEAWGASDLGLHQLEHFRI